MRGAKQAVHVDVWFLKTVQDCDTCFQHVRHNFFDYDSLKHAPHSVFLAVSFGILYTYLTKVHLVTLSTCHFVANSLYTV